MKRNTSILFKTSALVLGFVLLLGVCILSLSFFHADVKPNDDHFLTPEHAVAAPTAQELLQKKFDAYNTVTEEDGKRVVTIFSEEQIADIRTRRENGEWFWLSSEEMLYLINDTVKLFEEYDAVYIRDLDGNLKKYYGLSFFSSDEYYASFGGFDLGVTDASFDLKKDVYETIFGRVEVLNSAVYGQDAIPFAVTDIDRRIHDDEIKKLKSFKNPWHHVSANANVSFSVSFFNDEAVYYCGNIQGFNYGFSLAEAGLVYPKAMLHSTISSTKYDAAEPNIVIELYDEKSQILIARLRYARDTSPKETAELEDLATQTNHTLSGGQNVTQVTNYRVVAYFNGFHTFSSQAGIVYCPDGDLNLFAFTKGDDIFQDEYYPLNGSQALAEYINGLLAEQLSR